MSRPTYRTTIEKSFNISEMTPVLLPGVADSQMEDTNKQPQFIRRRWQDVYKCILDTRTVPGSNVNPADCLISSSTGLGDQTINLLITPGTKKISVTRVMLDIKYYNVNSSNNTFNFTYNPFGFPSQTHTVSLTPGRYSTVPQMGAAIVSLMNQAVSNNTAFQLGSLTNDSERYIIALGPGAPLNSTFSINSSPSATAYDKGKYVTGLFPFNDTFLFTSGRVTLISTRWVDISSFNLTQYVKGNTNGNNISNNTLIRLYVDSNWLNDSPIVFSLFTEEQVINFNPNASLSSVDIRLLDEFGNIFPIPTFLDKYESSLLLELSCQI